MKSPTKTGRRRKLVAGSVSAAVLALTLSAVGASAGTGESSFLVNAVDQSNESIQSTAGAVEGFAGPGETAPQPTSSRSGVFAFTISSGCDNLGIYIGNGSDSVTLTDPTGTAITGTAGLYAVANPAVGEWVAEGEFEKLGPSGFLPGVDLDCLTSVTRWQADDASGTFSQDASHALMGAVNLRSVPALPPTVRKTDSMFVDASVGSFVNGWDTSRVTSMAGMFSGANFDSSADLSRWNTENVASMEEMFFNSNFNGDISSWKTSKVENMRAMFMDAKLFNQNISQWETGNVRTMEVMFSGAHSFNQPLNSWDVSKVESFLQTFRSARAFNQPLDQWKTDSAQTMRGMFSQATSFNQDISMWNTGSADKTDMFYGATAYAQARP